MLRRVPRRFAASIGLALAAPAALLPAQESAPTPAALLAQLRAPDLTLADATACTELLAAMPTTARLQGIELLRAAVVERQQGHDKAAQRLAKDIHTAAAELQKNQLGKRGAATVESLRHEALSISRRDGLSKEIIHAELDPRVDELRALLLPTAEQLRAAVPELEAAVAARRLACQELARWHALYVTATAGLELHPDAQKYFAKSPPPPPPPPAAAVDDEVQVWTLLGLPLGARDRRTLEANESQRATTDPEEFAGTGALNRLRYVLGLPLLRLDEKLSRAARDHSTDMATLGFFDHTSPVPGKRTPGDRAARFGTSGGAENIATGHDTGESAIRGWWYSPGHHRNMLGGHGRTGLGRSTQLWTQMFGG